MHIMAGSVVIFLASSGLLINGATLLGGHIRLRSITKRVPAAWVKPVNQRLLGPMGVIRGLTRHVFRVGLRFGILPT